MKVKTIRQNYIVRLVSLVLSLILTVISLSVTQIRGRAEKITTEMGHIVEISDPSYYASGCLKSLKIYFKGVYGYYAASYAKIGFYDKAPSYDYYDPYTWDADEWPGLSELQALETANGTTLYSLSAEEFEWTMQTDDGSDMQEFTLTVTFADGQIPCNEDYSYKIYKVCRTPDYGVYPDGEVLTTMETHTDGSLTFNGGANEVVTTTQTTIRLDWAVSDISVTRKSNKAWDPAQMKWVESSQSETQVTSAASTFTLTNYSTDNVCATVSFEVDSLVEDTFDSVTFTNNNVTVKTPSASGAGTYTEEDYKALQQTITATLNLKAKAFSSLVDTESARYGTYTVKIAYIPVASITNVTHDSDYTHTLTASLTHATPASYQWYQTDSPLLTDFSGYTAIDGATGVTYTAANVDSTYIVAITDTNGQKHISDKYTTYFHLVQQEIIEDLN